MPSRIPAPPIAVAALAAAALLVLAACGGGGAEGPVEYDGPLTVPYDGPNPPADAGDDGSPSDGGDPATLAWRTLDAGVWAPTTSLQTLVARDAAGYAALRAMANTANAPAVDFETEMVVAVFLDTRPTGGYSVDVTGLSATAGDGLEVAYTEFRPPPGLIVTQALTVPWVLAAVTRRDGPVTFTGTVTTADPPPTPR